MYGLMSVSSPAVEPIHTLEKLNLILFVAISREYEKT